jgi:hypothetical protein
MIPEKVLALCLLQVHNSPADMGKWCVYEERVYIDTRTYVREIG